MLGIATFGQLALGQIPFAIEGLARYDHSGGYVKKRKDHDLIDEELARRGRLRSDLELAFYGPEPEPLPFPKVVVQQAKAPIDVGQLAGIMGDLTHQQMLKRMALENEDEENYLELILKGIL